MAAPPEWDTLLRGQCAHRPGLFVTSCTSCPRRKALLRDGAPVQIERAANRALGTGLHALLERIDPATAEVRVVGTMWGMRMSGRIDRLRDGLVCDHKLKLSAKSAPTGPYPEETWQAEMYRNLLAQNDIQTTGWVIYHFWNNEWFDFPHSGPILDEAELGRFRPHGSQWEAREIARLAASVDDGAAVADIPLVGEAFPMGKLTACAWCEVEGACKEAAGSVEF